MDEEISTKKLIEERIRALTKELKNTNYGSDQYGKIVKDIRTLVEAYSELDRAEVDKADKDRKFAEDLRYKELELYYRDALERDKLNELKASNKRDAIIKVSISLLTTIPMLLLALLGMKLEFIDHGTICTVTAKELWRKAMSTKIV